MFHSPQFFHVAREASFHNLSTNKNNSLNSAGRLAESQMKVNQNRKSGQTPNRSFSNCGPQGQSYFHNNKMPFACFTVIFQKVYRLNADTGMKVQVYSIDEICKNGKLCHSFHLIFCFVKYKYFNKECDLYESVLYLLIVILMN